MYIQYNKNQKINKKLHKLKIYNHKVFIQLGAEDSGLALKKNV